MRLLVCNWKDIRHPAAGGAEVFIHRVVQHWVEIGHEVVFVAARPAGLPSRETIDGVDIIRVGNRYTVYREARRLWEAGSLPRADLIVDVVNTRPFLTPLWPDRPPVVALIYQVAEDVWHHEFPYPVAVAGRRLERRWLRRYADVPTLTISEDSRQSLEQCGLRNVSIIPVGLDVHPVQPAEKENRPTIIFVGRLASNKRPDDALKAFDQARAAVPDAQMWVVGTGPLAEQLERRWSSPDITFHGRVDEKTKFELMARAHALVVTSVREGWGMVVTEAAAVGTPSIGYAVPGLSESISGSNGVLVPPNVPALAEAIVANVPDWVVDPPVVKAVGVAPWDEVAETMLDIIGAGDHDW